MTGFHRLTRVAVAMYTSLGALSLAAMKLWWEGPLLAALFPWDGLLLGGGAGAVGGLALVAGSHLWERASHDMRALGDRFRGMLTGVRERDAIVLALASSLGEELLFRGLLLPTVGLPLSAIVFGLLHGGPDRVFLQWTAAAVVAGGLFGALALATGSLWAPVTAHFVVNWLNLRRLARDMKRAHGVPACPP